MILLAHLSAGLRLIAFQKPASKFFPFRVRETFQVLTSVFPSAEDADLHLKLSFFQLLQVASLQPQNIPFLFQLDSSLDSQLLQAESDQVSGHVMQAV